MIAIEGIDQLADFQPFQLVNPLELVWFSTKKKRLQTAFLHHLLLNPSFFPSKITMQVHHQQASRPACFNHDPSDA